MQLEKNESMWKKHLYLKETHQCQFKESLTQRELANTYQKEQLECIQGPIKSETQ